MKEGVWTVALLKLCTPEVFRGMSGYCGTGRGTNCQVFLPSNSWLPSSPLSEDDDMTVIANTYIVFCLLDVLLSTLHAIFEKEKRTFLTYLKPQVSLGPPGQFTGPKEATCLTNQIIPGSRGS